MKMKIVAWCCTICLTAGVAFADMSKDEINRLRESATVLNELRDLPDNGIPTQLWDTARCVLVIPSLKRAAFVFGGEYGAGVMSCRHAGAWSAPVFMKLAKGSWGLQIGAESVDLVLLVMNQRGVDKLLQDKVSLGADASVAAGPVGRAGNASTDAQMNAEMLSYSRSQGLFAGIDLSGGVLQPDKEALAHAYGPAVRVQDVIAGAGAHAIAPPMAARSFTDALNRDVRATTGRK
jgi:lipid-binding SYLF domain-containing protein